MKTIKYFTYRIMAVAAIAIAFALPAKAQITPMTYFNVDWQFSAPISNNFSNKELTVTGRFAELAAERGVRRFHVTLSHTKDTALAVVVLEGE